MIRIEVDDRPVLDALHRLQAAGRDGLPRTRGDRPALAYPFDGMPAFSPQNRARIQADIPVIDKERQALAQERPSEWLYVIFPGKEQHELIRRFRRGDPPEADRRRADKGWRSEDS